MFENPRRGRQARNFTTNAPKILDLKSSSEQIFSRKLPLRAPEWNVLHKISASGVAVFLTKNILQISPTSAQIIITGQYLM